MINTAGESKNIDVKSLADNDSANVVHHVKNGRIAIQPTIWHINQWTNTTTRKTKAASSKYFSYRYFFIIFFIIIMRSDLTLNDSMSQIIFWVRIKQTN